MKIMSGKKYAEAIKVANETGTLAGFAGMSLIIFGGIAVAGVVKNTGNLVMHRIKDNKAAKEAIKELEELKDTDTDSEE